MTCEIYQGGAPVLIPPALENALGGVKAPPAAPAQTEIVGIGSDGRLRVTPGGSGGGTAPAGGGGMQMIALEVAFPDDTLLLDRSLTPQELEALNRLGEHEAALLYLNHFVWGASYPSWWFFVKDAQAYQGYWLWCAGGTGEAYRTRLALNLKKNTLRYQVDTAYDGPLKEGSVKLNVPTARYYAQGDTAAGPNWIRFHGTGTAAGFRGWTALGATASVPAGEASDPSGSCWTAVVNGFEVIVTQSLSRPYLKVRRLA